MAVAKKVFWSILGLLLAVGVVVLWLWRGRASEGPKLTTTALSRGEIVQAVTATGELKPLVTTEVSSQISGQIAAVAVDFNDRVKAGQLLARIDPATYRSRLEQAEAQLASVRAARALAQATWERTRSIRESGLVSQAELDGAAASRDQADAQLRISEAAVANARTDLARCTIYAPIDGIVIDRVAEVGMTVAASFSAPKLFTIANDLARMRIEARVAEADVGKVALGQEVKFTVDAFPERTFRGTVAQVRNSPKTDQNVVTYTTIIDVANDELLLKPGMTASVSIVLARRAEALRLPNAALRVRLPEGLLAHQAPAANGTGTPGARGTGEEGRRERGGQGRGQLRELFSEAGFTPGSGPPSPEVIEKVRRLAAERGIELPEGFGSAGGRGRGGERTGTTRTVYRPAGPAERQRAEAVTVRLGISDGLFTEILDGLAEGDLVVTGVSSPGASAAGPGQPPAQNPLTGGRMPGPPR